MHTKFALRAESRGVLPFIVDLQGSEDSELANTSGTEAGTVAVVKITDVAMAHGINVLESGENITALREYFDWAQPTTVREYLQLTGAELAPNAEEAQEVLEPTVLSLSTLYGGFETDKSDEVQESVASEH